MIESLQGKLIVMIKRRNNKIAEFFEMFEKDKILSIRDIKRKTPSSTFYKVALREIINVNSGLKEIHSDLEFMRPAFQQEGIDGPVYYAIERAENVTITHNENFFFLNFNLKKAS